MRKIHNCLLTNDLAVALLVEALNGKPDGKHREGRGRAPPHMVETGVKCIPLYHIKPVALRPNTIFGKIIPLVVIFGWLAFMAYIVLVPSYLGC